MSDEVLERLVKDYLGLRFQLSGFAWQGGEPTLMGLDFYKRAVELQKKYGVTGQEVGNSLQTNALLLDNADWGRFLHENKFLVGISIDGPKELHDHYRLDLGGHGTWDRVMRAIDCCKEHQVEFNTLTLVNHLTADHPDEVFDFLIGLGVRYLQFIPCVEVDPQTGQIAEFSVSPKQYADFPVPDLRPVDAVRPAEAQHPRLRFHPELLHQRPSHDLHLRPAVQPVHRRRAHGRRLPL